MSASLVGSEMCIRDRGRRLGPLGLRILCRRRIQHAPASGERDVRDHRTCLLYTSDAADDM
eukprot:480490-Alexandrium_andersonii.AAC.1